MHLTTYRAPGRVNLIGEHTDYNQGFVLPVALDLGCTATARPNGAGRLRLHSLNNGDTQSWDLREVREAEPHKDWTDYVIGVARELERVGYQTPDIDLEFESDVPLGGGLSSSAALEVAAALALAGNRKLPPLMVAQLCHRAENEFVGLPCGIMDQFASVFGEEGAAILIDCQSQTRQSVRLPAGVVWLIVDSKIRHTLATGSGYGERVEECRRAAKSLGVDSLRAATAKSIERLEGVLQRRARHVVTENARVLQFVKATAGGDVTEMGQLMVASHLSLQKDYEVSCPEIDFLVSTALSVQGVLGARITGAGFGGCTVNLMAQQAEHPFRERVGEAYRREFGTDPVIHRVNPSGGARKIS